MTEEKLDPSADAVAQDRPLPPAARRALEEARLRREAEAERVAATEVNGPKSPEPTRYGDWEKNGIASDF